MKYLFQQYGKGKSPSTGLLERYSASSHSFYFIFVVCFLFLCEYFHVSSNRMILYYEAHCSQDGFRPFFEQVEV